MNTQKLIVDLPIPKKCPLCSLRFICSTYFDWVRWKIPRIRPFNSKCLILGTCTVEEKDKLIEN